MSRNEETKKQHFVPKTYLKHFATEKFGTYYINAIPVSDFREEKISNLRLIIFALKMMHIH